MTTSTTFRDLARAQEVREANARSALVCLQLEWPIIPWAYDESGDKVPRVRWRYGSPLRDRETVIAHFQRHDHYAGFKTGPQAGVFLVDVDPRNGGAETMAALLAERGPLPDTLRVPTPSGGYHLYFEYPTDGRDIITKANQLGPGVDTKGWGGFAAAPGAVTPKGVYGLPDGPVRVAVPPPWLVDLAERPAGPERGTEGSSGGYESGPSRSDDEWLAGAAEVGDGGQESYLFRFLCSLRARNRSPDEMRRLGYLVAGSFRQTKPEPWQAKHVDEKVRWIVDTYPAGSALEPVPDGAAAVIAALVTPSRNGSGHVPVAAPPLTAADEAEFWSSRPALASLRDFARARLVSPWAVLGTSLLRVASVVPPSVTLPPIIGSNASLNTFIALVGSSGDGKDTAMNAAVDAITLERNVTVISAGSGEGLVHQYVRVEGSGEDRRVVQFTDSVIFKVPEVDTLAALKGRSSSTLLPMLRDAWTGSELGFAYVDPAKRLTLRRHTYRLGLVVGVQPERAGVLLGDADSGTPQRFLWLTATDPHPERGRTAAEPLVWQLPARGAGRFDLDVCDAARETIIEARIARLRGDGAALDGHALLCRLKVAALLTLLDRRLAVTDEDWRLAGLVQAHSDAVRAAVVGTLATAQREENRARGIREGEREAVRAEVVTDAAVRRVAKRIGGKLGPQWVAHAALRRSIAHRDREHFEAAVERLVDAGQIEVTTEGETTLYRAAR